ncbi:MAG: hypothetical protein EAZ90_08495 [Oscillatoriales cyanobacterium]|nr:MAG: hypothetical protein EAZ94_10090 [Oscillatoriales cyanobacterium]TAE25318.1 MAG: hypothetical protein EAZ93_10605 [Oscillatoriales cyanobacterium]TAE43928.1 MAG: hypothetical protein EAZ90_08495 [Oscillatoriales cyanobacterium]TAF91340.1 MAG: hypothetical protein EAZ49_06250 [Oscillatoriales cyanobacterium]TAG07311.1 MAG: hypothetical protein EAZ45_02330 [Oscillatoriales cyanobacterium]
MTCTLPSTVRRNKFKLHKKQEIAILLEIFSYFKQRKLIESLISKSKPLNLTRLAVFKINLSALPTLQIG